MRRKHRLSAGVIQRLICLFLFGVALIGLPSAARAETPARTESFVYAATAFDGQIYQSSFAPPSVDTLYLIADAENVLATRWTQTYYWPLTNRYEADWLLMNEFVEGKLEIHQGDQLLAALDPADYVVQYDAEDIIGTRKLSVGPEAQAAYEAFQARQAEYRDALYNYYQAYQAYRAEVDDLLAKANGQTLQESDFPPEPQEVEPLSLFSTEIAKGFIVKLPAGTYTVQLRLPDGSLQPGSHKNLVIFNQLKTGIAYNIVPKSRWTEPESSQAPDSVIYSPLGTTVYLQPFQQGLFNEYAYAHMLDPQDTTSRSDRNRWVTYEPYSDGLLVANSKGSGEQKVSLGAYHIAQSAGSGLGYEVQIFEPATMETPSFEGYELTLNAQGPAYTVHLVGPDGKVIAGSERQVRVMNTTRSGPLYGLSSLPLLAGVVVVVLRRRQIRKIKVEG